MAGSGEKIGGLFVDLAAGADEFRADMAAARAALATTSQKFAAFGKKVTEMGRAVSAKLSAPLGAFGALSVRTAVQFDDSMRKVAAKSGATGEELKKMSALARDMGRSTRFSASQSAEAMTFLAQAGLNSKQVMASLGPTMKLAATEGMNLGDAADIATNVMSGMRLPVSKLSKIVDVLAEASRSGNTNVMMLGESFGEVAPLLKKANISVEAGAAAFAIMGSNGIQAGKAGNALKSALAAIAKPGDNFRAVVDKLGISLHESNGDMKPLVEIIRLLEGKLKSTGVSMKDASGKMKDFSSVSKELGSTSPSLADFFNLFKNRGAVGMAALVAEGADKFQQLTDKMKNSEGAASEMEKVMEGGVGGSLRAANSAFEDLQISIANSGLLEEVQKIAEGFSLWAEKISKNNPQVFKWTAGIIAAGVALGPLLLGLGALVTGIGLLISPAGLAVAAIAGLGVAIHKHQEEIKTFVNDALARLAELPKAMPKTFGAMKLAVEAARTAWEFFSTALGVVVQEVSLLAQDLAKVLLEALPIDKAKTKANDLKTYLLETIEGMAGGVSLALNGIKLAFTTLGPAAISAMRSMMDGVREQLVGRFSKIVETVGDKIGNVSSFFFEMWNKVTKNSYVPDMMDDIKSEFGRLAKDMVSPTEKGTKKVSDLFDGLRSKVASSLKQVSTSLLEGAFGAIFNDGIPTNRGSASLMKGAGTGLKGFRFGGDGVVTGTGGVDSALVQFRATPGERFSVSKPGDMTSGGGGDTHNWYVNDGVTRRDLFSAMSQVEQRASRVVAADSLRGGAVGRTLGGS